MALKIVRKKPPAGLVHKYRDNTMDGEPVLTCCGVQVPSTEAVRMITRVTCLPCRAAFAEILNQLRDVFQARLLDKP